MENASMENANVIKDTPALTVLTLDAPITATAQECARTALATASRSTRAWRVSSDTARMIATRPCPLLEALAMSALECVIATKDFLEATAELRSALTTAQDMGCAMRKHAPARAVASSQEWTAVSRDVPTIAVQRESVLTACVTVTPSGRARIVL